MSDHTFLPQGDRGYLMTCSGSEIVFQALRLRRHTDELHGELTVRVNGAFPDARTVNGLLCAESFNFSSNHTRTQRAKYLRERSRSKDVDWDLLLSEFCMRIHDADRQGRPAIVLADEPEGQDEEVWTVGGFPLLKDLPEVLYGAGGGGKSLFTLWLVGMLAEQGVPVLYADWEFSAREHRRRFGRLFPEMPRSLFYARCDRPLTHEVDRLQRLIDQHQIQYLVIDSVVFALENEANEDQAGKFYRALRQLKVGSLCLAHTSKSDDEKKTVFGSSFFENGARMIWLVHPAERNADGELTFGLFNTKNSVGQKRKPHGYKIVFGKGQTTLEEVNVSEQDELLARMPLLDRLLALLKANGPQPYRTLIDELNVAPKTLKAVMVRHKSQFQKHEPAMKGGTVRYGLAGQATEIDL